MIREEAMVLEWPSDPHPADAEIWDAGVNDEIPKLRTFIEGQFRQQAELLTQLMADMPRRGRSEPRASRSSSRDLEKRAMAQAKIEKFDEKMEMGASPPSSKSVWQMQELALVPSKRENSGDPPLADAISTSRELSREDDVTANTSLASPRDEDRVDKSTSLRSPRSVQEKIPAFGRVGSASLNSDVPESDTQLNSPSAIANYIMRSQVFIYGIMFVIMFNLISLGIEVDLAAKNGQEDVPEIFDYMNLIVVIIFVFELAVNVTANGVYKFVCGGDCLWNFFDVIIVALSAFETGISFLSGSTSTSQGVSPSHLRFMRPIRLARALRGVRVMRLFRYVGALRTLLLSIMSSIASLFWTIVLLLLLFYSFGVLLTQLVSDFCRAEAIAATDNPNAIPDCSNFEHRRYWQSVPAAMLTLFMAISGGIDWDDALIPLRNLDDVASTAAVTALILYIVITVFTVVNVVTGVFCNTAIESAAADKDIAVMKQMRKHAAQVQVLKHVFREIDEKSNNLISMEDLQEAMSAHKLSSFFESMGIATQDVMTLFQVIDSDGSGSIDLEEFVSGCMRLHGPAKSLDVAKIEFENEITKVAIKNVETTLDTMKEQLGSLLAKMPSETSSSFAV